MSKKTTVLVAQNVVLRWKVFVEMCRYIRRAILTVQGLAPRKKLVPEKVMAVGDDPVWLLIIPLIGSLSINRTT